MGLGMQQRNEQKRMAAKDRKAVAVEDRMRIRQGIQSGGLQTIACGCGGGSKADAAGDESGWRHRGTNADAAGSNLDATGGTRKSRPGRVRVAAEGPDRVVAQVGVGDVAGGTMTKNAAGDTKVDASDERGLIQQRKRRKPVAADDRSRWRRGSGMGMQQRTENGCSRGNASGWRQGDRNGGDLKDRMPTRQGEKLVVAKGIESGRRETIEKRTGPRIDG
jgi:hypothetical protein